MPKNVTASHMLSYYEEFQTQHLQSTKFQPDFKPRMSELSREMCYYLLLLEKKDTIVSTQQF
jgi:hypothetical protein